MKNVAVMVVSLLLLTTTTLLAQTRATDGWTGFSLTQLETLSSNVFEQLDIDENGSITLDEIDLLKQDSEDPLSEEELSQQRQRLNLISSYFWTEKEINIFEVADTNGDGSMNRDEYDNLESNVRTRVLKLGIEALDSDKNGSVETSEFSAHLNSFDEWDSDGNGTLDRIEMSEISDRRFHTDIRRRWAGAEERRRLLLQRERRAAERERRAAEDSKED